MTELALQIGSGRNLLAIVTPPTGEPQPIGILILNAGVIHRIGPHRTGVKLARRLASQGWIAVRFDISGIGDSRPPRNATDFRSQAVADARAVMDYLQQEYGLMHFALFGICSGAMNAHSVALVDNRVVGTFMVDGYVYKHWKTPVYRVLELVRAHGPLHFMIKVIRTAWRGVHRRSVKTDRDSAFTESVHYPTRQQYGDDLHSLNERGVQIALLCSGSFIDQFSYARQWHDIYRGCAFLDHVDFHFDIAMDHTITTLPSQANLLEMVENWMRKVTRRRATEAA